MRFSCFRASSCAGTRFPTLPHMLMFWCVGINMSPQSAGSDCETCTLDLGGRSSSASEGGACVSDDGPGTASVAMTASCE